MSASPGGEAGPADDGTGEDGTVTEPGDAVCWLERVCEQCGALEDGPPPPVCPRCGAGRAAG